MRSKEAGHRGESKRPLKSSSPASSLCRPALARGHSALSHLISDLMYEVLRMSHSTCCALKSAQARMLRGMVMPARHHLECFAHLKEKTFTNSGGHADLHDATLPPRQGFCRCRVHSPCVSSPGFFNGTPLAKSRSCPAHINQLLDPETAAVSHQTDLERCQAPRL